MSNNFFSLFKDKQNQKTSYYVQQIEFCYERCGKKKRSKKCSVIANYYYFFNHIPV